MTLAQWLLFFLFWATGGLILAYIVAHRPYRPMRWRDSHAVAFLAACGPIIWLMTAWLLWRDRK